MGKKNSVLSLLPKGVTRQVSGESNRVNGGGIKTFPKFFPIDSD